jgi:acyl-coenzyme A synthetase/AMP-(fatty) acid ligase
VTPSGWASALADPAIAHVVASPVQLAALLAAAPGPAVGKRGALAMGGAVPPALAAAAEAALGCPLLSMYGTTELGACAIREAAAQDGLRPLPGVHVAVTDAEGRPLPEGETGHLRLIAPGMALQYHDDPVETLRRFRDGWFLPGDLARLQGGLIHLAGRADEVVNIGGMKLDPDEMDRLIAGRGLAAEAAAFRHVDPDGRERLMIASVTDSDAAFDRLRREVAAAVAGRFPVGHYRVDAIPRNEMGKPLRRALAESLARRLAARGAGA